MSDPNAQSSLPPHSRAAALWEAMRPTHWVKNGFVVAPLIFAGKVFDLGAWWRCLLAVIAFNCLSSAVYLINDTLDRESDRLHPEKRNRPIASGRLSVRWAITLAVFLVVLGGALAIVPAVPYLKVFLERKGIDAQYFPDVLGVLPRMAHQPLAGIGLVIWGMVYFAMNLAYSLWLKRYTIIDVIMVAFGFVLRAMAGAAAIDVPVSPWLVICTFTFCLFLALVKRRAELTELSLEKAKSIRRVHKGYRVEDLDLMLTVSTAIAIMSYCLYCLAPRTVSRLGSAHMVWTIPLVMYGIFRFVRTGRRMRKGDLVSVLLADKILWLVVILYVLFSILIIQFGPHSSVRNLLDVGDY